ncbi:MAG TPA: LLM class F420-dependent oxidoreductase [Acidimicrobiales bacterium]|nr:LLM class F420-dependent oxidoreductase [Acidimicrobiales bacterium]
MTTASSSSASDQPVDPGRIGLWTGFLDGLPTPELRERVAEIDERGWGALWLPEAVGREPLVNASLALHASSRLVVATGIAGIYSRDAMAMAAGHRTLTEAFPNRFLLGLGVSHQPMVEGLRGHDYSRPLATMRAYLDAMDAAIYVGAAPPHEPQRVLAALGPKMTALAAERATGAHPYFVPLDHTPLARAALGAGPLLCVEQAVVLETDPARAREIARTHTAIYTTLPNYTNNLRRHGFGDDDFAGAGSDRLVDAIVAWGDEQTVADRVRAHLDAGADHVCIQVVTPDYSPGIDQWRRLADVLLA